MPFALCDEIAIINDRVAERYDKRPSLDYQEASRELTPHLLIDSRRYHEYIALAQYFDSTKPDSLLLCGGIRVVCDQLADRLKAPGSFEDQDVESAKKIMRVCYFILRSIARGVETGKNVRVGAVAGKQDQKLTESQDDNLFACLSSIMHAVKRIILLGFAPFGSDEDECQALAEQYMEPILSLLAQTRLETKGKPEKVFDLLASAHKYHSQTQQLVSRVVRILRYHSAAKTICIKFMRYLLNQGDDGEDRAVEKMINSFLTVQIDHDDSDLANQVTNLAEFIKSSSADTDVLKVLCTQYRTLISLLEDQDPKIRGAAVKALDEVLKVQAASYTNESDESGKVMREIIETYLKQTLDNYFLVRNSIMKSLSEFYSGYHQWLNRAHTQDLLKNLIKVSSERMQDVSTLVRAASMGLFGKIMLNNTFLRFPGLSDKAMAMIDVENFEVGHLNQNLFDQYFQKCSSASADMDAKIAAADDSTEAELQELKVIKAEIDLVTSWYHDGLSFCKTVDTAVVFTTDLLLCAKMTDLSAIIALLESAYLLNVESSEPGVIRMLNLVWIKSYDDKSSNETEQEKKASLDSVTTALLDSFANIWLYSSEEDPPEDGSHSQTDANGKDITNVHIASRLMSLVSKLTSSEITSFERLLQLYFQFRDKKSNRIFWESTVARLWEFYGSEDTVWRVYAAVVLSILISIKPRFADGKEYLIEYGFKAQANGAYDYQMGLYTCRILQNIEKSDATLEFVDKIRRLLTTPSNTMEWFAFAHEAIRAFVHLSKLSQTKKLLARFNRIVFPDDPSEHVPQRQTVFYQMIYIVGEMVLLARSFVDDEYARFTERLRHEAEEPKHSALATGSSQNVMVTSAFQNTNRRGLFCEELVQRIKREFLRSDESIFHLFAPKVHELCVRIRDSYDMQKDPDITQGGLTEYSPFAQVAAVSTLGKLMCAEKTYCRKNVKLLCELLQKTGNNIVKSTVVVAMSDLNSLHSHEMEDYTNVLFDVLNSPDKEIQRTVVVVVTFLILGGKVKVRGNLGNMARLLHNEDARINSLAHTFFSEFSTRDKSLYNAVIQILNSLDASKPVISTNDDSMDSKDPTLRIVRTLCGFLVSKADNFRTLEKLEEKLRRCENARSFAIFKTAAERLIRNVKTSKSKDDKNKLQSIEEVIKRGFYDADAEAVVGEDNEYELDDQKTEPSPKKQRVSKRIQKPKSPRKRTVTTASVKKGIVDDTSSDENMSDAYASDD